MGKWRFEVDPFCIDEDAKTAGLDIVSSKVGEAYCLLSFRMSFIRDCVLENNNSWFCSWFLDAVPWEDSDLAVSSIRSICLKGVSLSFLYD